MGSFPRDGGCDCRWEIKFEGGRRHDRKRCGECGRFEHECVCKRGRECRGFLLERPPFWRGRFFW